MEEREATREEMEGRTRRGRHHGLVPNHSDKVRQLKEHVDVLKDHLRTLAAGSVEWKNAQAILDGLVGELLLVEQVTDSASNEEEAAISAPASSRRPGKPISGDPCTQQPVSMAGKKNDSERHPLYERSDEDALDAEPVRIAPERGDSDYRALRIAVYGGNCARRNPKKKENADPYVTLTCHGETRETTQLYGTTHPQWNETFEFPIYNPGSFGQVIVEMWDRNDKKTEKGQIFLGEVLLSVVDFADVNFEHCEPRPYRLEPRNRPAKTDNVKGDLTLKIGMVVLKRRTKSSLPEDQKVATEQLIAEAEDVADDSWESVQRSLKMAENTSSLGADTLDMLHAQGEQLRRIQERADNIDDEQYKAARHMKASNSLGGAVQNTFTSTTEVHDGVKTGNRKIARMRKQKEKDRKERSSSDDDDGLMIDSLAHRRQRLREEKEGRVADVHQADFAALSEEAQVKIKRTDQALDAIGGLVDDMKVMALEMGDELDEHNERLKILDSSIARASSRMKDTNANI